MTTKNEPTPAQDTAPEVITLEPKFDANGQLFWAAPGDRRGTEVDVVRGPGGSLSRTTGDGATEPVSVLPRARMAGDDPWADVIQAMGESENRNGSSTTGRDVVMAPGGQMRVTNDGGGSQPLSVLPKARMASYGLNPDPDPVEAREIVKLDPRRVEGWQPVTTRLLSGWRFHLRPELGAPEFQFLAFRSPVDRNLFRVYVISPNADDLYGHVPHMIQVVVGNQQVPVICGPNGEAARDLATARGHAAKWMLYTYQRVMRGVRPGFSE